MSTWQEVRARWSAAAHALWDQAQQLASTIAAAPSNYVEPVKRWFTAMWSAEDALNNAYDLLQRLPPEGRADAEVELRRLQGQHAELDAGMGGETAPSATVGIVPIVVVAVGAASIALTALGAAWAVSSWAEVQQVEREAKVLEAELQARVEAMRTGKALPPSSIDMSDGGGGAGAGMLAALALAGVLGGIVLSKRL